ncbi:PadR family transcriptional regulator [Microbacterium rhizomatis]|uniref:PadR family transcriptional regulator n=1 Tax=Microbacterium rhizomatis TaxID=1631477 RepID=A0A5J5J6Y3_9MICO|nr:PadR family transcriptional regulator [Microbacterium rhizomatis]KAA9111199.1 PadR family transcriptional regulator [Microbacterium rhizomatis]
MSVRSSLLAILDQGPCYGYQLRTEFERRTGSTWPLNVGQIYRTLERLERDGLVAKGETDPQGHVYYAITDAGSAAVAEWLTGPGESAPAARSDVAIKIAVSATLPGVDAAEVVAAQRRETASRLETLSASRDGNEIGKDAGPLWFARSLIADSQVFAAEAELRWLDHVAALLAEHPDREMNLEPSSARPSRGRPRTR